MNGTTKKQQNTQGQERVNCLKIDKRRNWVRYLTNQKDITLTDTYNSESLIRIKKKIWTSLTERSIKMWKHPLRAW